MKQFLLVAGVDYEFKGVDFRQLADSRLLERQNAAKADLRFVRMDVRSGQVETREVTFPGGKRTESVSSFTPFATVGPASYQTLAHGSTRFKPGQWTAMGITDVYQWVQDIGRADPGTLAELSIFSHGWMGGPILVDSDDDRTMEVTLPAIPPLTTSPTTLAVRGFSRDPDDKDGRPGLDFRPPTMDPAMSSCSAKHSTVRQSRGYGDARSRGPSITRCGRWNRRRAIPGPGSGTTSSWTCPQSSMRTSRFSTSS